jgi:transcriptional regulator with XRE-family HTH domain
MVNILPTKDIQLTVAKRMKDARLSANLTQLSLSLRAGISLGSLKRFERAGEISFKGLVQLAFALRREDDIASLFLPQQKTSLDALLEQAKNTQRQRGRKS